MNAVSNLRRNSVVQNFGAWSACRQQQRACALEMSDDIDGWEAYTAVVPGITGPHDDADDQQMSEERVDQAATVTIDVGSNVKITIQKS